MTRVKTLTIIWPDGSNTVYRNKPTRLNRLKAPFVLASFLKEAKARNLSLLNLPPFDVEGKDTDRTVMRFEQAR